MQVSSLVDPARALRHEVASKARDTFASLKAHSAGDAETVARILHALFSRLQVRA